jgi:hypothetical protein
VPHIVEPPNMKIVRGRVEADGEGVSAGVIRSPVVSTLMYSE